MTIFISSPRTTPNKKLNLYFTFEFYYCLDLFSVLTGLRTCSSIICNAKISRPHFHIRDLTQKSVSILLWNFSFIEIYPVCLAVLKLTPAEYATNAVISK